MPLHLVNRNHAAAVRAGKKARQVSPTGRYCVTHPLKFAQHEIEGRPYCRSCARLHGFTARHADLDRARLARQQASVPPVVPAPEVARGTRRCIEPGVGEHEFDIVWDGRVR